MANPPESTKSSFVARLNAHTRATWPQLTAVQVRFRGPFAYLDGQLPGGEVQPLCRLRYGGSASTWGFALYLASSHRHEDQVLPTGRFTGTAEEALDCACALYLSEPLL